MGTDDLFHKRKQANLRRETSKYRRSKQSLKVLIVCDDSKSAVYYFEALRNDLGLNKNTVYLYYGDFLPKKELHIGL